MAAAGLAKEERRPRVGRRRRVPESASWTGGSRVQPEDRHAAVQARIGVPGEVPDIDAVPTRLRHRPSSAATIGPSALDIEGLRLANGCLSVAVDIPANTPRVVPPPRLAENRRKLPP
jgi:hypothetical protein